MKLIAARACPACARAGFLSIFLLLGGCGALPLPDKPVRPQPYDLGPALPQAASAAPSGPALALGRVDAPPAIDGVLVGGASPDAQAFASIGRSVAAAKGS